MTQQTNTNNNNFAVTDKDREILQAVRAIKYGTVLIVINNSEVVQIESTNKKRFDLLKLKKQSESF
jgi:hypothetical protein